MGWQTHSQRNGNREYHIYCCVGGNKAHTDTHDLRRSYVDPYRLSRSHVEPHRCPRSSQNGGMGSALGTWIGLLLLGAGGMAGLALHMKKRKS